MKSRMMLFLVSVVLLAMPPLMGWTQEKYVPKPDEEIYGTWINKQYSGLSTVRAQKRVVTADGYKNYVSLTDPVPQEEGTWRIIGKWTDAEGNIWYRSFCTVTSHPDEGVTKTELDKLSNSATVWEYVYGFGPSDLSNFPTTIDPIDKTYNIRYRADAGTSSSASATEKDWTLVGSWVNKAYEHPQILPQRWSMETIERN